MTFPLTYKPYGASAILVEWPPEIEKNILSDVLSFKTRIVSKKLKQIIELRSAYNSLLVIYNTIGHFDVEVGMLKEIYNKNQQETKKIAARLWKIPVCYGLDYGIDLKALSKEKRLSTETIIDRHSSVVYTIYFIGFLPGFLYLGGLDKTLFTPRRAIPRLKIEKGAVAIGGDQTGVYPSESPGGWHIIGNSPISFFDPKLDPPCFARAGDHVVFVPISASEYKAIKTSIMSGVYQLESEVIDG